VQALALAGENRDVVSDAGELPDDRPAEARRPAGDHGDADTSFGTGQGCIVGDLGHAPTIPRVEPAQPCRAV
jgi:hypothetical protein